MISSEKHQKQQQSRIRINLLKGEIYKALKKTDELRDDITDAEVQFALAQVLVEVTNDIIQEDGEETEEIAKESEVGGEDHSDS